MNKGKLIINNLPNSGAKITAFLKYKPADIEQADTNSNNTATHGTNSADARKAKLLVVEDEASLRSHLDEVLSQNFIVSFAENGKLAMESLSENELPDIILSDVMMPEMSGFELCKLVKENAETSHIPVLLLTAKADLDSQKLGLTNLADDYMTKPFSSEVLVMKISNLHQTRQAFRKQLLDSILSSKNIVSNEKPVMLFANKVQEQLSRNYSDEAFAIQDMASTLAVSEKTLNRRLKSQFGQSFTAVLRDYRLERAYEMLKFNTVIQNVAFDVGFTSPAYFTKCFRERFGVKPSEVANK